MDEFAESLSYLGEEKDPLLRSLSLERDEKLAILDEGKIDAEQFLRRFPFMEKDPLIHNGYRYPSEKKMGGTLSYFAGAISIQDPSSALPVEILGIEDGDYVLDMCAAPGGKSIQAALSTPHGMVLSNDLSHQRALSLSQNIERMGLGNVMVTSLDLHELSSSLSGCFDKVILDAPCSGEAMFRKLEEAKLDWDMDKVLRCAKTQKDLLSLASVFLREGGTLCYSTCSFSYEEDIGQIIEFLKENDDFELIEPPDHPGFFHHQDLPNAIYLFPHRYRGEGQFLALLRKKGNAARRSHPAKPDRISPECKQAIDSLGLAGIAKEISSSIEVLSAEGVEVKRGLLRFGAQVLDVSRKDIALAHGARFAPGLPVVELDESRATGYLAGEEVEGEGKGYVALAYGPYRLGIGKAGQGKIKNRLPKGLRRKKGDVALL